MIDRKPGGEGKSFWKMAADPVGDSQDRGGLSNKAIVYLVIIALIIILCIVYGMQLRKQKGGSQSQNAVTAVTASSALTSEIAVEVEDLKPVEAEDSGAEK